METASSVIDPVVAVGGIALRLWRSVARIGKGIPGDIWKRGEDAREVHKRVVVADLVSVV